MDKEQLTAYITMLDHWNTRLEGYCKEIINYCGLTENQKNGIKQQIFYAQNHLKLVIRLLKKAMGEDDSV